MKNTPVFGLIILLGLTGFGFYGVLKEAPKSGLKVEKDTTTAPYFLFLSDIHLNTFSKTTDYGGDTGMELWIALQKKLSSLINSNNPPQFIVYTGDLPAHYSCSSGCYLPPSQRGQHNENLRVILSGLKSLADLNKTPLFYAPGNNDALSGDYYSFADSQQKTPFSIIPVDRNTYPALNVSHMGNKAPCMISDIHPKMGYYSAKPIPGLRIIALNTIIFGTKYSPVDGVNQLEAGNAEMKWLEEQLKDAKANGDKVYIAMHIPPGTDAYALDNNKPVTKMWVPLPDSANSWLNAFLRLNNRYQQNISGILYGHTHMDEVRRLYDSTGLKITTVAISCPGVTPQHYNNPGFKMVYFNADTKALTDFVTSYSTPGAASWMDSAYRFSKIYHSKHGSDIYETLSSQSLDALGTEMNSVYTVMHGSAGYDPKTGIEVKWSK